MGLSASREASRFSPCYLSDAEMLEVIKLADQYCLSGLVAEVEIQLSERIITKIKSFTDETPRVMQRSKNELMLDECVGKLKIQWKGHSETSVIRTKYFGPNRPTAGWLQSIHFHL